jgi:hypothetical protein
MATSEQTLNDLQHLTALYRQGHRSPVVDLAVEKLVTLEREHARHEADELDQKLKAFEERYHMTSENFYRRFRTGELGDEIDPVEWSIFYEMRAAAKQRLMVLESRAAYDA